MDFDCEFVLSDGKWVCSLCGYTSSIEGLRRNCPRLMAKKPTEQQTLHPGKLSPHIQRIIERQQLYLKSQPQIKRCGSCGGKKASK